MKPIFAHTHVDTYVHWSYHIQVITSTKTLATNFLIKHIFTQILY